MNYSRIKVATFSKVLSAMSRSEFWIFRTTRHLTTWLLKRRIEKMITRPEQPGWLPNAVKLPPNKRPREAVKREERRRVKRIAKTAEIK